MLKITHNIEPSRPCVARAIRRCCLSLRQELNVTLPTPLESDEANAFLRDLCKKHNVECKPPQARAGQTWRHRIGRLDLGDLLGEFA